MRPLNLQSITICTAILLFTADLAEPRVRSHGLWLRNGADDAYADSSSGQIADREYVLCGGPFASPYAIAGFRFKLYIPRGAQVVSSSLDLAAYVRDWMGGYFGSVEGMICAEDVDDASDFNHHHMGSVPRTSASVNWDHSGGCTDGRLFTSPDISAVVQEVVDRPGWKKGNWIAILFCNRAAAAPRKARYFRAFEDRYFEQYRDTMLDCTFQYVIISGHIRRPDGAGVEGVVVSTQDGAASSTTDPNGYYMIEVGMNWNGTVVPDKAGWAFYPNVRPYVNATPEQPNQDFIAFVPPVISGRIVDGNGTATADVLVSGDNGGGSGVTDANGDYELTVAQHWSGTVTPYKAGWAFEPDSRAYADLTIDQNDQDYTSFAPPIISGFVRDINGLGTGGIIVSANNGGGSDTTDANGYYEFIVGQHWSGAVTPYKDGWAFEPNSRDYADITLDQNDQDYTGFAPPVISGWIREANGTGVGAVALSANNGGGSYTTDANGHYAVVVPQKWSGRITPVKYLWFFDPAERLYENITYDISGQDITGTKGVVISGTITNTGGHPISLVDVSANNGGTQDTTETSGFYEIAVPPGWTGEVTLATRYPCRLFVPESRPYHDLIVDQTDQTYISPGLLVSPDGVSICQRIQLAMHEAVDGDEIILEPGIYSGRGNYRIYFYGLPTLTIRSTDPQDPNIVASTVIDLDGQGPAFVFEFGEDANCVLDGITIRGGDSSIGGAIYCSESSPTIRNCLIKDCFAWSHGGGIGLEDSSATITNCIITGNSSVELGGGIAVVLGGKPKISNCIITDNYVDYLGGGVGGWYCDLNNCIVTGNTASLGGGIGGSDISVTSCTVAGNIADYGGGICSTDGIVMNSIVWGNSADAGPQIAVYGHDDEPNILTVSYSDVLGAEGSVYVEPTLVLSWGVGNIDADPCFAAPGFRDPNGTPEDPNDDFWVGGDYHLLSQAGRWDPCSENWLIDHVTSCAIDAGDPNSPIGTEPLPNGGRINIGGYGGTVEASKSPAPTCWDPAECAGQSYGDATCDGLLSLADVFALKAQFGKSTPWTDIECCADFDHDGAINLGDLFILKANFASGPYSPSTGNQSCPP